jgi:hypothetical protein
MAIAGGENEPVNIMAENKGNPSGRKAQTKSDAGAKSTSRERRGQAGAFGRGGRMESEEHPAGEGRPEHQAGGPDHRGGDAHEDRNP